MPNRASSLHRPTWPSASEFHCGSTHHRRAARPVLGREGGAWKQRRHVLFFGCGVAIRSRNVSTPSSRRARSRGAGVDGIEVDRIGARWRVADRDQRGRAWCDRRRWRRCESSPRSPVRPVPRSQSRPQSKGRTTRHPSRHGCDAPSVKERADTTSDHAYASAASTARAMSSRRSVSLATSCSPTGKARARSAHGRVIAGWPRQVERLAQAQHRVARRIPRRRPDRHRRRAERGGGDRRASAGAARRRGRARDRLPARSTACACVARDVVLGRDVAAVFEPRPDGRRVVAALRLERRGVQRGGVGEGRSAGRRRHVVGVTPSGAASIASPRGAETIERRGERGAHVVGEPLEEVPAVTTPALSDGSAVLSASSIAGRPAITL